MVLEETMAACWPRNTRRPRSRPSDALDMLGLAEAALHRQRGAGDQHRVGRIGAGGAGVGDQVGEEVERSASMTTAPVCRGMSGSLSATEASSIGVQTADVAISAPRSHPGCRPAAGRRSRPAHLAARPASVGRAYGCRLAGSIAPAAAHHRSSRPGLLAMMTVHRLPAAKRSEGLHRDRDSADLGRHADIAR